MSIGASSGEPHELIKDSIFLGKPTRHRSCTPSRSERIRAKHGFLKVLLSNTHPRPGFRAKIVLYCTFFDSHGIVASNCVPKKLTITAQYYAEKCLGEVHNHYFSRRQSRGAKGIRLLDDNARPNKAKAVREMFDWVTSFSIQFWPITMWVLAVQSCEKAPGWQVF